jgi:hypothetical protein
MAHRELDHHAVPHKRSGHSKELAYRPRFGEAAVALRGPPLFGSDGVSRRHHRSPALAIEPAGPLTIGSKSAGDLKGLNEFLF